VVPAIEYLYDTQGIAMEITTLYANFDCSLRENAPTTNQNALGLGIGPSSTSLYNGVVGFDYSSLIGIGVTEVTLAKLRLYIGADFATASSTLSVYRMIRSGVTETGCTWNTYDGTHAWGTVGCNNTTTDREASSIGTLARGAADTGWHEITLDNAKTLEILQGVYTNPLLLLKDANTTAAPSHYLYETRENYYSTGNTAELYLEYETGIPGVKTVNGVAMADIKTINGIPIADIKSLQGLTFSGDWLRKLDWIRGLWQPKGLVTI
jgi:hypothetical protein